MGKRSFVLSALVFSICLVFTANSAMAGSKQHERWKGVAIGVGAAILGSVILSSSNQRDLDRDGCYDCAPERRHSRPMERDRGHWENRREWVPAQYHRVWKPGHYNRRGDWVKGSWIKVVKKPGYYTSRRVWVSREPGYSERDRHVRTDRHARTDRHTRRRH